MRTLNLITILFLLSTGNVNAQTFEPVEDSTKLEVFNNYVDMILEYKVDSILPGSLLGNYRLIYRTSCSYSETLERVDSSLTFTYATAGKHIAMEMFEEDSIDSVFGNQLFSICLEHIVENVDTTYFLTIENNIANTTEGKTVFFSVKEKTLGHLMAISFNASEYIILTHSGISSIGSQTSYGGTWTYFLKKIKD